MHRLLSIAILVYTHILLFVPTGAYTHIRHLSIPMLLPDTSQYMTYEGSTTHPGCWETAVWIILNKPIYITMQEVRVYNFFLALYPQAVDCINYTCTHEWKTNVKYELQRIVMKTKGLNCWKWGLIKYENIGSSRPKGQCGSNQTKTLCNFTAKKNNHLLVFSCIYCDNCSRGRKRPQKLHWGTTYGPSKPFIIVQFAPTSNSPARLRQVKILNFRWAKIRADD